MINYIVIKFIEFLAVRGYRLDTLKGQRQTSNRKQERHRTVVTLLLTIFFLSRLELSLMIFNQYQLAEMSIILQDTSAKYTKSIKQYLFAQSTSLRIGVAEGLGVAR